ncbi:GNAT family N-acetyltransferase [Chryseobacterium oranimense]|uniref:GNAT family N-acetyltransferase n=1 Tax=Chryseobacterium oranimense TaxID=421058 RepID=UPI002235B37C|nr:GNAT family N-acetyltransferase [Chryseobacterium oranimense]
MKLKKGTEKDIPLIRDLARRSWESAYVGIISQEQIEYMLDKMYSDEEILSQFQNPDYHYYLIFDENNNSFEGFMGYENNYEAGTTKLHRIYLVPESKGKGFGKEALIFLKDKVSESGNERIILNVNKVNSAKKFYESQGYRVYDEVVLDIGGNFVMDDYLMEHVFHK